MATSCDALWNGGEVWCGALFLRLLHGELQGGNLPLLQNAEHDEESDNNAEHNFKHWVAPAVFF